MDVALADMRAVGVRWIALHPYARLAADGTVTFVSTEESDHLSRAMAYADEHDMQVYWVPHLAVWRTFAWRGEIAFSDEAAWRRFFDGYTAFVVDQARFAEAAGVELFSMGLEYEGTTHRESEWREVIARVREVYTGRLTYAANWDRIDRVGFWDALDIIGVQGYFPLSENSNPQREEVRSAWRSILADLEELGQRENRPILFNEVGYARSRTVASRPWEDMPDTSPQTLATRELLMETAIEVLEAAPFVEGMFWWKWIPGSVDRARNFSMRDREAREVLRRLWGRSR